MGWHFKDGRMIATREEQLLEVAALARIVNEEMPDAPLVQRIRRAMQLNKGTMHPADVGDALLRQRPDHE
jgi:outer membrane protein TolC